MKVIFRIIGEGVASQESIGVYRGPRIEVSKILDQYPSNEDVEKFMDDKNLYGAKVEKTYVQDNYYKSLTQPRC